MDKTFTLENIDEVAREMVPSAPATSHATILELSGDLGVGKTTLAQALARALGVAERVPSPTFILERVYKLADRPFERLIHIDAYRMEKPEELAALGWDELCADPKNLILIEWPERVAPLLPEHAELFKLSVVDEAVRRIESVHGPRR